MTAVQLVLLPKAVRKGACSMCRQVFAVSNLEYIYGVRGAKACPSCYRQARQTKNMICAYLRAYGWPGRREEPETRRRPARRIGSKLTREEAIALSYGPATSEFSWHDSFRGREWERQAVERAADAQRRYQHAGRP